MSALKLYAGNNDHLIELLGAQNAADDSYLNSAVVSAVIKDSNGTAVTGSPVTLSYVASSNGNYRGTLDKDAGLTDGEIYTVTITLSQSGIDAEWEIDVTAEKRAA